MPSPSSPRAKRLCSVPDCAEAHLSKGYCPKHYQVSIRGLTRARRLKRLFQITPEEFEKIQAFQADHPVYGLLISRNGTTNAVEHRHKDGLIRGVMAPMLNRAYGLIERLYPYDTAEVLRALAEFHENHPASEALAGTRYGAIGRISRRSMKNIKYGSPVVS